MRKNGSYFIALLNVTPKNNHQLLLFKCSIPQTQRDSSDINEIHETNKRNPRRDIQRT